ncbi:transposase [Orientia tsutsugamushi]|uniref:Transposase n=2 Tax=Orientia tsutsugamushi TaxID=784 RepID=A0A2R8F1G9_ORITS|nr:putative transposase [Orientia tsutsugamushi str. TA716]SPM45270.1 transposase [Orientia tsutsugamushi]
MKSDMNYEVVLIDATESPIERPKKTKILLFMKEENSIKSALLSSILDVGAKHKL